MAVGLPSERDADMEERFRTTMSDGAAKGGRRRASQRFAEVEDELRQEDGLASLMADQWRGMAGMAGMFVATIALAIYIRPYYDVGELHAFGASGATQVRYVAIELIAIFAFTALIIFLAKWGKEFIIKYGMYAVLALALLYATVPLAHMAVLDFEPDPFVVQSTKSIDGDMLGTWGDHGFIVANVSAEIFNSTVDISAWDASNGYTEPIWTMTHNHSVADSESTVAMTQGLGRLTFASGAYAWTVDASTGELLESYPCFEWIEGEAEPLENMFGGCTLAISTLDSMYLVNPFDEMIRFATFDDDPTAFNQVAEWNLHGFGVRYGIVHSELLSDDHLVLVTASQAGSVLMETVAPSLEMGAMGSQNATFLLKHAPQDESTFTSVDVGWSPYMEDNFTEAQAKGEAITMVIVGESNGTITAWEWDGEVDNESAFTVQERMQLEGLVSSVASVRITDLDDSGYADLLIADSERAHWLYTTSLVNRGTFDLPDAPLSVFFAVDGDEADLVVLSAEGDDGVALQFGALEVGMFPLYGLQLLLLPTVVGLVVTVVLLILLVVHSEWYVVNLTGVLLGAGVCVMLGVTFVPILAILFMVLAAIYDYWAVYKSKHMLDLADTMIGLRLPILLVAPQDSDYSLIEETNRERASADHATDQETSQAPVKRTQRERKSGEAMFMGLGDVIFPGMLVLSALQWLDPSAAFAVAMTTLLGGLAGYVALMSYVARGKAQAGLPLLNGGAILGYLLGGMFLLGSEILFFNISW